MTPDLDAALVRKYPRLLAQRNLPVTHSCLGWGIECADGWFHLLDGLFEAVAMHVDEASISPEVAQAKQKLGTLRVYWDGDDEFIRGATWLAEEVSARTCEVTGAPGRTTVRGGFVQVLCPQVAQTVGAVPPRRAKAGDATPLQGADVQFPTAEELITTYGEVLKGAIDVPPGWMPLSEAVLVAAMGVAGGGISVSAIVVERGELKVTMVDPCAYGRGIALTAWAIADRTDLETGVLRPVPESNEL